MTQQNGSAQQRGYVAEDEDESYHLHFEPGGFPSMEGLEVQVRPMSLGLALRMSRMRPEELSDDKSADANIQMLADHIVSWNVEDRSGNPVPPTVEFLLARSSLWVTRMINAWLATTTTAPPPLPGGSNSGGQFPEGSIPMEPLSNSLQS